MPISHHLAATGKVTERYGKVTSKKQTIFGYKLQLLVTLNGVILDFELAEANQADLKVSMELLEAHSQLKVIGDKAYISQPLQLRLEQGSSDRTFDQSKT